MCLSGHVSLLPVLQTSPLWAPMFPVPSFPLCNSKHGPLTYIFCLNCSVYFCIFFCDLLFHSTFGEVQPGFCVRLCSVSWRSVSHCMCFPTSSVLLFRDVGAPRFCHHKLLFSEHFPLVSQSMQSIPPNQDFWNRWGYMRDDLVLSADSSDAPLPSLTISRGQESCPCLWPECLRSGAPGQRGGGGEAVWTGLPTSSPGRQSGDREARWGPGACSQTSWRLGTWAAVWPHHGIHSVVTAGLWNTDSHRGRVPFRGSLTSVPSRTHSKESGVAMGTV